MAESSKKPKKPKMELSVCIICGDCDPNLNSLKSQESWETLYKAAEIRKFQRILEIKTDNLPQIFYHRACRSNFTHKKSLDRLSVHQNNPDVELNINAQEESASASVEKKFLRTSNKSDDKLEGRVYEKKCIFCEKIKYIPRTKTRETLTQAVQLRADQKLRDVAKEKNDSKILTLTSRDIVAAEAHYHVTCYKDYTRNRPEKSKEGDPYLEIRNKAFLELFDFIRTDIFSNPRLLPLTYLREQFEKIMNNLGAQEISKSTYCQFKSKLEWNFSTTLHFLNIKNLVYFYPNNFTFAMLAEEYIKLKEKYEEISSVTDERENEATKVASFLRQQVKESDFPNQDWPPNPQTLQLAYDSIPKILRVFFEHLFGGNTTRAIRLSWSISQDVIYGVSHGKIKMPKHILLPWAVKTLTGNVEIIKMLNRLGHGCSYSKLEEIDTALCLQKLENTEKGGIALPSRLHPGVLTIVAYDNIDRQEEVLSGGGTSHRINGIIVQPKSDTCLQINPEVSDKTSVGKKKPRTIPANFSPLPCYLEKKKSSPPPVVTADDIYSKEEFLRAKKFNLIWTLARLIDSSNQTVSSWTGFNIMIRDDIKIESDTVEYLPTINAPATEMPAIQEILRQCNVIREKMNMKNIVLVCDQAIYAKVTEVAWSALEKYSHIIFMMGNFHTICNFLSIIGKVFGEAGLQDLAVESGVIAQGSISRVLEGKHYNRAIRFHKLLYESFMRLIWKGFLDWLEKNYPSFTQISAFYEALKNMISQLNSNKFKDLFENPSLKKILPFFDEYKEFLKNKNGSLSSFWMLYVEMIELLLGFLRADREGNWQLHLYCVRQMIPFCFALDKINYARYLSFYLSQISNLKEKDEYIFEQFQLGKFSVQLRDKNPFSKIAVDQTLEETINKDTQTSGGTRGFSLKPGTLSRFYLTNEYRAEALRQMREALDCKISKLDHPDLHQSRIKKDEKAVSSLLDLLENNWTNPFGNQPSDIVHLATGIRVKDDVASDLLSIREQGENGYKSFKEDRLKKGENFHAPLKKLNLKLFSNCDKKKNKIGNKETILQYDRKLFGTMVLIAENRRLNMREVFCHPLGSIPWSLANADGTMRKTKKSSLSDKLEKTVSSAKSWPSKSAIVIDAMALIHKVSAENLTFEELSETILKTVISIAEKSERIDVVFDFYTDDSIKNAERNRRGSTEGMLYTDIRDGHRIKNWKRLLSDNKSKNQLNNFLVNSWKTSKNYLLGDKILFASCGDKCFKIDQFKFEECIELASSHEEADTRLLLHMNHAAKNFPAVICAADDTDVFILCLSFVKIINSTVFIRRGVKSRTRLVNINMIAESIGSDVIDSLIGLHAFTGCDTVSAFAGQGKLKGLKLLQRNQEFQNAFKELGTRWIFSEEIFAVIEKFTCQLYSSGTKINKVNELRYWMFSSKKATPDSGQLPPCEDSLKQHTLRANYQAAIWRRCLENSPEIPDPTNGYGWCRDDDGNLDIVWITGLPAPEVVLQLLKCDCARACVLPSCSCISNNLKCTAACKLSNCGNVRNEDEDEDVLVECNSDIDSDGSGEEFEEE